MTVAGPVCLRKLREEGVTQRTRLERGGDHFDEKSSTIDNNYKIF